MKKRITIDITPEAYKALSIEAIEQGVKVKYLIEQVTEKEATKVLKVKSKL